MDEQAGSERHILEAHLDGNRATVVRKCSDVTWEEATRRLGPTATSIAGILKHLIDVERWWFRHHLDGQEGVAFFWSDTEPDREFAFDADDTLASLISAFQTACADSREVAARYELTDQLRRPERDGNRPSLRWVYVHMIEELARHNGHLDIYRELIDGQTDRD